MATTYKGELLPFKKSDDPYISGSKFEQPVKYKGKTIKHAGVDLSSENRDKGDVGIYSTTKGKVTNMSYEEGGAGYHVTINDGKKDITYMHLKEGIKVKVGQEIDAGQRIGTMGSTGASSGEHLHYEVRESGVPKKPFEGKLKGKDSQY